MSGVNKKPYVSNETRRKSKCVISCAVPKCGNNSDKNPDFVYHSFPKMNHTVVQTNAGKVDKHEAWKSALKMSYTTNTMYVCSNHFAKDDYLLPDVPARRRLLKRYSVPSQNLPDGDIPEKIPRIRNVEIYSETPPKKIDIEVTQSNSNWLQEEEESDITKVNNISCSVPGCHTRSKKNPNLIFHSLPRENERTVTIINDDGIPETMDRRKAWILKLRNLKEINSHTKACVCSLHFKREDYLLPNEPRRIRHLKKNAVPSQYLPPPTLPKMPTTCIVLGCTNRSNRDKVSFHTIPSILRNRFLTDTNALSKERREKWIAAIGRDDLTESKMKNQKVCGKHFISGKSGQSRTKEIVEGQLQIISGKPALLEDKNNPDWIPWLYMGHEPESNFLSKTKSVVETHDQVKRRKTNLEQTPIFVDVASKVAMSGANTSNSQPIVNKTTKGKSSVFQPVQVKEEPLEADPLDCRIYEEIRDSVKKDSDNSETSSESDPNNSESGKKSDKEPVVNVKQESSDSSDNETSENQDIVKTIQTPIFESVFVKAEPLVEEEFSS